MLSGGSVGWTAIAICLLYCTAETDGVEVAGVRGGTRRLWDRIGFRPCFDTSTPPLFLNSKLSTHHRDGRPDPGPSSSRHARAAARGPLAPGRLPARPLPARRRPKTSVGMMEACELSVPRDQEKHQKTGEDCRRAGAPPPACQARPPPLEDHSQGPYPRPLLGNASGQVTHLASSFFEVLAPHQPRRPSRGVSLSLRPPPVTGTGVGMGR